MIKEWAAGSVLVFMFWYLLFQNVEVTLIFGIVHIALGALLYLIIRKLHLLERL